jgi:hypothetical protein
MIEKEARPSPGAQDLAKLFHSDMSGVVELSNKVLDSELAG